MYSEYLKYINFTLFDFILVRVFSTVRVCFYASSAIVCYPAAGKEAGKAGVSSALGIPADCVHTSVLLAHLVVHDLVLVLV